LWQFTRLHQLVDIERTDDALFADFVRVALVQSRLVKVLLFLTDPAISTLHVS
jgi:hypothetical protein